MTDHRKLNQAEAVELNERVRDLTRADLSLVSGLVALGEESPSGPLRRSLFNLADSIAAGEPLESALESQQGHLSPQLLSLLKAGIRTGRLDELVGSFSSFANVGVELRRKCRAGLAYPLLSIVIAFAIFTFSSMVLVPKFEAIFLDFGIPIPLLTKMLIDAAHVFQKLMPLAFILVTALMMVWLLEAIGLLRVSGAVIGHLPLVGRVWRSTSFAEYFHLLALLIGGDVPLPEAVRISGDAIQDFGTKEASIRIAREIQSGRGFADSLASVSLFPRGFSELVKWAEKPGSLPEVLHMIGNFFEVRAQSQITITSAIVGVLAVVVVLWGAVLMIFGLMLPLVTLISKLSG